MAGPLSCSLSLLTSTAMPARRRVVISRYVVRRCTPSSADHSVIVQRPVRNRMMLAKTLPSWRVRVMVPTADIASTRARVGDRSDRRYCLRREQPAHRTGTGWPQL